MFEVSIEGEFAAAHAIVVGGAREALHGHNWRVRVTVGAETLDAEGLLVDFHELEHALEAVIGPFRNGNLNEIPPFTDVNPSAENVARHIGDGLAARLARSRATLEAVHVEEAPRCWATYRPGRAGQGKRTA